MRLTTDVIAYTVARMPKWNPVNVCSYHLQEAGATPVQEIAYALGTAIAILDAVRDRGQVPPEKMGEVVGRISFFVNAGVRFVEEMCKVRAFTRLWDAITRERYGIDDPAQRRFRYGVQVNSLGLTEAQPENNIQRIVLEMLAVTLSSDARARAIQLPAWNEALGLPRAGGPAMEPAHPAGAGVRVGPARVRRPVRRITRGGGQDGGAGGRRRGGDGGGRGAGRDGPGGGVGVPQGPAGGPHAARRARIESGEDKVVGVNCFQAAEPSPLTADADGAMVQHGRPGLRAGGAEPTWRSGGSGATGRRYCAALARLKADADDVGTST